MIWTSPVQSGVAITPELHLSYYWLIYPVAFFVTVKIMLSLWSNEQQQRMQLFTTLAWSWLGVVIGARLFYVLFYGGRYFVDHPESILDFSSGGMSFHGALLGLIIASAIEIHDRSQWIYFMDRLAVASPWAIALGRVGNYLNGELPGRPTDQSWGVIFPHVDMILRHPSTLYAAAYEGVALGIWMSLRKSLILKKPGRASLEFIVAYSSLRFAVEFFREPDSQLGYAWFGLTWGQWLCVIFMFGGIVLVKRVQKT